MPADCTTRVAPNVARSSRSRATRLAAGLALATVLSAGAPAAAQIPDTFENLQILPADIARDELAAIMRGFSMALGVRCQYCHPGGSGNSLQDVDFVTDEDADKVKARYMMKMVAELNGSALAGMPDRDSPGVDVGCVTCHRGLARPITLEAELARVIDQFGMETAVTRYRELREQYYGSGSYDFGEDPLNELAAGLARGDRVAEAVAILELNAEQHPESAQIAARLGALYAQAGDREKAIASYERALRLEPGNRQARQALDRLRGG